MGMTDEEIEESRKKLGIKTDKTKKHKATLCQANQCSKHATDTCKYCERGFCEHHLRASIATTFSYIQSMGGEDYEKQKKYNEDWQRTDGHPCVPYTEKWNEEREDRKREGYKETNKLWGRGGRGQQQSSNYQTYNQGYTYHGTGGSTARVSKSDLLILYDKWLLKHAFIFSVVIAIIATLPIGFVIMSGSTLNLGMFTSSPFLFDFVVIFIIFMIYRKFAGHFLNKWAGMTASILNSTFLLGVITFSSIVSVIGFIEVLMGLFIANYISNLIGKGLGTGTYSSRRKALIYSGRAILIIFAIVIVASLSLEIASFLKASGSLGNGNNSIVNSSLNDIGTLSNTLNSGSLFSPKINGTWATAFFSNVSKERGSQYTYCANLSTFANKRFNTMAQNYGISHYGYSQDFNSTWPYGVQVGDEIYYGFGEEVFYPSGYNASNYVQQVITTAPLHWQELADTNYTSYGYYIGNGPAYEILGPDGGYQECPVTEIPGPNINIQQYFAQYGCSVETSNLTYFVLEIAPFCPYGG